MPLLRKLRASFSKGASPTPEAPKAERQQTDHPHRHTPCSYFVFANTGEVMSAEQVLCTADIGVRVMAPPPALRTGCDMVLVVPDEQVLRAENCLGKAGIAPLHTMHAGQSLLHPVSLFQHKDFGEFLMVRAANMKLTVEKATGKIVNISGGGCPDVPYLAATLIGQTVHGNHSPREYGSTLCGYALELAFAEAKRLLCEQGNGR